VRSVTDELLSDIPLMPGAVRGGARRHRRCERAVSDGSVTAEALAAALATVQSRLALTPDRAAFAVADHLAPVLVRHLATRLTLMVAPVLGALLYYRFTTASRSTPTSSGRARASGRGRVALYPFAALAGCVTGSDLRAALLGPG
jgi:hypothetical protein